MTFLKTIVIFDLTQIYLNFLVFLNGSGIDLNSQGFSIRKLSLRFIIQTRVILQLTQTLIRLAFISISASTITLVSGKRVIGLFCSKSFWFLESLPVNRQ